MVYGPGPALPSLPTTSLGAADGFQAAGLNADDQLGSAVAGLGDINGDGYGDVLFTAPSADPDGTTSAGEAYVVFGSTNLPASIALADLNGTNGFVISGANAQARAGSAAAAAGDFNGDGRRDFLIAAEGAQGNAGCVYLIYGAASFPAHLDLADVDGNHGIVFTGEGPNHYAGRAVAGLGDFNGDGYGDIVIGAHTAPDFLSAGRAYVVFGGTDWPAQNSLAALDGATGFRVDGSGAFGYLGAAVASCNLNGDGLADVAVGAPNLDEAYVIFGRTNPPAALSVTNLDGANGFTLAYTNAVSGFSAALAGAERLNVDELGDLLCGAPGLSPDGRTSAGEIFAVFGRNGSRPARHPSLQIARARTGSRNLRTWHTNVPAKAPRAPAISLSFRQTRSILRLPMTLSVQSKVFVLAIAAMLLALFFWAVVPLMLEHFTHLIDPWTANGARYFFAASFWLPFVVRGLRRMAPAARGGAWHAALVPAAAHCASQVCFGLAPYYNNATILNFGCRLSIPFATLFGFWLLKSERPLARKPLFWAGLAAAIGGFLLMFGNGFGTESTSAAGMLLLLGFAVFWSLYVVFVRRNLSAYPVHLAYGIVSLLTGAPLLVLMFLLGDWQALLHLPAVQWLWLVLSALIGLTLGHVFYYRAIRTLGPIASEGSLLLIPFQTAVLAHFLLGERLAPGQWAAGVILILGCTLLLRARFTARA